MFTWEARQISPWLRSAANGSVPVSESDAQGKVRASLEFLEPNIAFSVAVIDSDSLTIRLHLRLECAPPSSFIERHKVSMDYSLQFRDSPANWMAMADALDEELLAYPRK